MNVVAEMLLAEPAPLAIWAVLLLAGTLSVLLLGRVDGVPDPHLTLWDSIPYLRRRRARRARRQQEAAHAVRYAEELTVATRRAARMASRWQEHCRRREQQATLAWQSWQDAEQRLAATRAAAAFTMPAARTPAEYADRERFLHRAITLAVERGDLPEATLTDLRAGRGGWNPWLHPVEHERLVLRAAAAYRRHLHRQAAMAEKAAWHDRGLAVASRDSLFREAAAATARAAAVRHLAPRRARGAGPRPAPAGPVRNQEAPVSGLRLA